MELALYCPLCGYYEKKEDTPGQKGDFYTSVSVGPLFGQMLAFQFAQWYSEQADGCSYQIVEAGAHDGRLAADILGWLTHHRPDILSRLQYDIVEPSPVRRSWQADTLREFEDVSWLGTLPEKSEGTAHYSIIFSNELLDAFPVHRLGWDAKEKAWFEWGVKCEGEDFRWSRRPHVAPSLLQALPSSPELLAVLPDGFTTEISPAAEKWWNDAARSLTKGKLLTFDYGLTAEEFFLPQRADGTLRAYRKHQLAPDPLASPGEQDLTTHVNFTAIQKTGEDCGLKTESFTSQSHFLTRIAEKIWRPNSNFGDWTQQHTKQFQTLTHPNHLGRAFSTLIQSR